MAVNNQVAALDKLNSAINKILADYVDDVETNVGEIAEKLASRGVSALKSASPRRTGQYAKGWTKQVDRSRLGTAVTIYNRDPGLPHLLENGHVSRNGTGRTFGRVKAYPHIAPIADELIETFEREVKAKL